MLAVPAERVDALAELCARHDVEWCDLGTFGTDGAELILRYHDTEVGRMPMSFLHGGLPDDRRAATWVPSARATEPESPTAAPPIGDALHALLAAPNIASKHWIVRQYDHEVQGGSVIKPLVGEAGEGPGDASVIRPVPGSDRGLAIANGLATGLAEDPYAMALAAIDECVRNLVCVGTDPERIAILDNFCWPGCDDPQRLGALIRASVGCYDGAKAYRTPFISGKDSLNNQFTTEDGTTIRIPATLLISGFGIVSDVAQCVTMDAKRAGNLLVVVGATTTAMGGSQFSALYGASGDQSLPLVDLIAGPARAHAVARAIQAGVVRSAHDCSEGGLLVAVAEMCIAGALGASIDLVMQPADGDLAPHIECFAETPSRYVLEVARDDLDALSAALGDVPHGVIGELTDEPQLIVGGDVMSVPVASLRRAWRSTLDW